MYLDTFRFPIEEEDGIIGERLINAYPCYIFSKKRLYELNFEPVTILYGGNGSGKSTALNLIAEKLGLKRLAPFNKGEVFDAYVRACSYELAHDDDDRKMAIPEGSSIITSDDVFDYMLALRSNNEEIIIDKKHASDFWDEVRSRKINREENILEHYEEYRNIVLARNKNVSRRQFIRRTVGEELVMQSNGETALHYFDTKLKNDKLYCLDEPENSLSPKMQVELVKLLESVSHYCGCQLIIATHSPFIMSIRGARIYDLDEDPVDIKSWWELENVRVYHDFFKQYEKLFESYDPKPVVNEKSGREPIGSAWLTANRKEMRWLLIEKKYSMLTIQRVMSMIAVLPDLEKENKAAEIIEAINAADDEKMFIQDYFG